MEVSLINYMARTFGGLTGNQSLVITALTDGTYFVYEETPSGTINGVNATFTLLSNPNPVKSLELRLNGQLLKSGSGNDFTISASNITMLTIPAAGDSLVCS